MKKKTLFKKLVSSVMVSIIALGQFSGFKFISEAAPIIGEDGPIYIALSKTNENGNGYAFGMDQDGSKGESIWSMVVSTDENKTEATNASNIYCIKAQYGESWKVSPEQLVKYNKNYEVPLKQNSEQQVANQVLLGEHKNEILWLIDNLYIPGESTQEDLTKYLNNAGIYYDDYDEGYSYVPSEEHDYSSFGTDAYPETVKEEDIVAIQQAAIWYYTNYEENEKIYNKEGIANWLQYTNETILNDATVQNKYPQLSSISEGRNAHATIIYNYLINQAEKVAETLGDNEYKLKNSTAKLWISLSENGTANDEQPVIEVHKLPKTPEKAFDLVLRKAIVSVNGSAEIKNVSGETATRELNQNGSIQTVDTSVLENDTTADYKHRKDPVVVKKGNIVKYSITIYNEGEEAGYATKIVDQLPGTANTLRLDNKNSGEVTSSTGNIYKVEYTASTNTITLTMTENSPKNVLAPYDKVAGILASETILLDCIVEGKADSSNNKILTNIAYIAEEYNADKNVTIENGTETQDRDSQTWNSPNYTAPNLVTTDIGYTGGSKHTDLTKNDIHYKGMQDDDDFEKLVILPEAFDLSLRKYITKVDGKEVVNSREPNEVITKLDNGSKTTAEYNHRKDPLVVENGSIVDYKISLYNEGSIDGIATIVKDQLPTGVKLNLDYFTKEGDKYFVKSSKGNVYQVNYDETKNIVTFTMDKTKTQTVTILKAHEAGKNLDEDILTLQCVVESQPHDKENTYLTNIAYIYQAEQEDGTIVEKQETGSDADRDSQPHTYPTENKDELKTIGNVGYKGNEKNPSDLAQDNLHFEGEQDDDDFEKLVILPKMFDLKLIKYITAINNEKTANRVLKVDTSKLNSVDANGKTVTTAEYILEKNPVSVKAGDFVTYTFRIYNEGDYDGYATEISEDIPEGLEFIAIGDNQVWSWDGTTLEEITEEIKTSEMYNTIVNINANWGYKQDSSKITTSALSEELINEYGKENVKYADSENKIDYKEISVVFRVKEDVESNHIIRNEAAITADKAVDEKGNTIDVDDRDSTPDEWKKEDSNKKYDEAGKWPIYKEDDEDYDNIITKAFDLALRKQIIQINNGLYTQRFAKLDTNGTYTNTLYDYYDVYSEIPKVKAGDTVTYSIRVYNEGDIDGYATLIVDELPSGLEFVEYEEGDKSINDKYGWKPVEGKTNTYQTDFLSYEKDTNKGTNKSTILTAYTGQGEASYQELYIECKVKDNVTKQDSLLNVAQIAEDSDENGKPIKDKDSVPGKTDKESEWKKEDDLDIEILELQEFDLALRKFITQIENGENVEEVTTRIPQVSYDKEKKQLVYTHPKDAIVVHVGDTVIYTLRAYNEGDIDGYASEIKDDIPEYLEYLPEHKTNIENEWVMCDKEGNETKNVEEAVFIKTKYLAKGHGAEEGGKESNLIEAFNAEKEISETNPHYKQVKVAFKVKDPNSTEYEIINFAQISDDTDSNGKPIKDRDSETDNGKGNPKEDDEDIEKVKVEYFDLSLLKYVTKVLVNENGQEKIIETGNIGDENDIIPHVQINKKNIDKTLVKFVYSIKITNEGQIAGEATEITDYVPEGLVFVAEDNEHWTDEGNNVISTKQLTGTILEPGETAEVEVVLRWINGHDNLGPKTNMAEISEDYNKENIPDRDSTPDNKKDGEDDIDDATVLLSVNQGGGIQSIYINLSLIFLAIIFVGGIIIKKFVL